MSSVLLIESVKHIRVFLVYPVAVAEGRDLTGHFNSYVIMAQAYDIQSPRDSTPTKSTASWRFHPESPFISRPDYVGNVVYESSSSGMFPLEVPATLSELDKLSFLANAMRTDSHRAEENSQSCAMNIDNVGEQPFIRVERGSDFADKLHEDFFPRTFPRLFPWGKGGPKATRVQNVANKILHLTTRSHTGLGMDNVMGGHLAQDVNYHVIRGIIYRVMPFCRWTS
jgi:hypothetical protein